MYDTCAVVLTLLAAGSQKHPCQITPNQKRSVFDLAVNAFDLVGTLLEGVVVECTLKASSICPALSHKQLSSPVFREQVPSRR